MDEWNTSRLGSRSRGVCGAYGSKSPVLVRLQVRNTLIAFAPIAAIVRAR